MAYGVRQPPRMRIKGKEQVLHALRRRQGEALFACAAVGLTSGMMPFAKESRSAWRSAFLLARVRDTACNAVHHWARSYWNLMPTVRCKAWRRAHQRCSSCAAGPSCLHLWPGHQAPPGTTPTAPTAHQATHAPRAACPPPSSCPCSRRPRSAACGGAPAAPASSPPSPPPSTSSRRSPFAPCVWRAHAGRAVRQSWPEMWPLLLALYAQTYTPPSVHPCQAPMLPVNPSEGHSEFEPQISSGESCSHARTQVRTHSQAGARTRGRMQAAHPTPPLHPTHQPNSAYVHCRRARLGRTARVGAAARTPPAAAERVPTALMLVPVGLLATILGLVRAPRFERARSHSSTRALGLCAHSLCVCVSRPEHSGKLRLRTRSPWAGQEG